MVDRYMAVYEPLDAGPTHDIEHKYTYLKCDHSTQNFVVNRARGHLMQKVVNFIMNLRTTSHSFYLTRHGQSIYNDYGRIGGDSGLSEHGVKYAEKLAQFVEDVVTKDANGKEMPARLWTSTMRRTKETTQFIKQKTILVQPDPNDPSQDYEWVQMRPRAWHHLDELFAGSCDGMTYEEIEERFPDEWKLRAADKLAYRYPRGESYLDVIARLEPIIIEMERHQEPLLIVAHQGILRIIYAFYMGLSRSEAPYVTIKLNCVTELTPMVYGCTEKVRFCSPVMVLTVSGGGCYCAMSREIVLLVEVHPAWVAGAAVGVTCCRTVCVAYYEPRSYVIHRCTCCTSLRKRWGTMVRKRSKARVQPSGTTTLRRTKYPPCSPVLHSFGSTGLE
jgi:broad specificity phosphatase PhoE